MHAHTHAWECAERVAQVIIAEPKREAINHDYLSFAFVCMYVCMYVRMYIRHSHAIATDTQRHEEQVEAIPSPEVVVCPMNIPNFHSTLCAVLIAFVCRLYRTVDMLDEIAPFWLMSFALRGPGPFSRSLG